MNVKYSIDTDFYNEPERRPRKGKIPPKLAGLPDNLFRFKNEEITDAIKKRRKQKKKPRNYGA